LAIAVVLFRTPEVFKMLGISFAAIALVRAVSIVVDHSAVQSNIISLASEIVMAIILIL
jgi:L-lactate utilization protein LutC